MIIGCPKEIKTHEYRVGITPSNVIDYVSNGHTVLIESGAGLGSSFSDEEYINSGAKIMDTADEIWANSSMIIKVKEPLEEEYSKMRKGQIIYTYLHLAASKELTEALLSAGVKSVAYETITDYRGGLPLLTPMSEVAGRLSVLEGAKYLQRVYKGRGVLLSGVPGTKKSKVVIIGGGIVGVNAAKMAIGFGADVTILDTNLDRLRYLDDIFGTSIQTIYSSAGAIKDEIQNADLVIGAVLIPGASAPKLIKREYLKTMLPGSVIVDVAVDQGGCCETTKMTYHNNPIFIIDDIVHYCVANMPGSTPRTSTIALTNATIRQGLAIANLGLEEAAKQDKHIIPGINTYMGKTTYKPVADEFGLEYTNVDALI
ncbi:MAG: alanine dehydrogenase [Defluviitaleaceae bacterium]|nr:alanine dehydrogenase [Defluviitaleaceae bacterium]